MNKFTVKMTRGMLFMIIAHKRASAVTDKFSINQLQYIGQQPIIFKKKLSFNINEDEANFFFFLFPSDGWTQSRAEVQEGRSYYFRPDALSALFTSLCKHMKTVRGAAANFPLNIYINPSIFVFLFINEQKGNHVDHQQEPLLLLLHFIVLLHR